jgi:hypothetical protein
VYGSAPGSREPRRDERPRRHDERTAGAATMHASACSRHHVHVKEKGREQRLLLAAFSYCGLP